MRAMCIVANIFLCLGISVANLGAQLKQEAIPQDISERVAQWLGENPVAKGKTSLGWLELEVYSAKSGQVFIEPKSGRFVMMSIRPKQLDARTLKDVGMEEALKYALRWMEQRGIDLQGWKLEERRRYDRGSAGIEYMFTWHKYSVEGVQLPSLMRLVVSGDGTINFWLCIDEPVKISLKPKISEREVLLKAQSIAGLKYKQALQPRLRVWFHGKQQQLWWEVIVRNPLDADKDWRVVIINAHTGELVDLIAPLAGDRWEEEKRRYLANARKVAKELGQCVKVEIFHRRSDPQNPVVILKQKDKRFQRFVFAVRKLLLSGEGITGAPPYGMIGEFPLIRFYITPSVAYEAKLDLKGAYFQILRKARLKREAQREFWEGIKVISVVVHRCPRWFIRELHEIVKEIPTLKSSGY